MRLSALQKYVLLYGLQSRKQRVLRKGLTKFYETKKKKPTPDDQQNSITKSLERMISKGLLIGYGRKTPEKWFIDEIGLTPHGRTTAKKLLGEQQRLPLKLSKRNGMLNQVQHDK